MHGRILVALSIVLAFALPAAAQVEWPVDRRLLPEPPAAGVRNFAAAREYLRAVEAAYGNDPRRMPLAAKAEFLEWDLVQHHLAPYGQIHVRVKLPMRPGGQAEWRNDSDNSTWQGALLAALSYKYAVTRDERTLRLLEATVRSLHGCFQVTGMPGLPARCVMPESCADYVPGEEVRELPGGGRLYFKSDAAKGTVSQIAGGYARLMLFAQADLAPETRRLAHDDLTQMILHLIRNRYQLTERDGRRTKFGNLTPEVAYVGVPFNAQVAYQIVSLGARFPPENPADRLTILGEFNRLRDHHFYFEDPLTNLVRPQEVASGPFIKGMNDVNHVTNAAFVGLEVDLHTRRRERLHLTPKFYYQLGQTIAHSVRNPLASRNALCQFQWAALLLDPDAGPLIVGRDFARHEPRLLQGLVNGFEQLQRYRIDRFMYQGEMYEADGLQWCDVSFPDTFYWKAPPTQAFRVTGPASPHKLAAIDFLAAYWLARYYRLDQHPLIQRQYGAVLDPPR